jgi:hypothetical protein
LAQLQQGANGLGRIWVHAVLSSVGNAHCMLSACRKADRIVGCIQVGECVNGVPQ